MQFSGERPPGMGTGFFGLSGRDVALCGLAGILAGAVMAALAPPPLALITVPFGASLALITVIDQRHFRIPDALSLPLIPLGLAAGLLADPPAFIDHGLASLAAGLGFGLLRFGYRRLRGIEGLGLGDVKLMTAAGAWTGLAGLAPVILLASGGALVTLLAGPFLSGHRLDRQSGWRTRIPFGAYLAPSTLLVWLAQAAS
jgi:leader peptidase (prepilin peptidase) / N-methyltransferase